MVTHGHIPPHNTASWWLHHQSLHVVQTLLGEGQKASYRQKRKIHIAALWKVGIWLLGNRILGNHCSSLLKSRKWFDAVKYSKFVPIPLERLCRDEQDAAASPFQLRARGPGTFLPAFFVSAHLAHYHGGSDPCVLRSPSQRSKMQQCQKYSFPK